MKYMYIAKLSQEDDDFDANREGDFSVALAPPKLKRPQQFRVVLLNDDYTPMEFVVEILERFFSKGRTQATQIMLTIHTKGKGVCGIYPRDIAETKAHAVNQYSREHQHPLLCEAEPLDSDEE